MLSCDLLVKFPGGWNGRPAAGIYFRARDGPGTELLLGLSIFSIHAPAKRWFRDLLFRSVGF